MHIFDGNLCIGKIRLVFKNTIPRMNRSIEVPERHSDAFVYVISGGCRYKFGSGEEFSAGAGDVFYLPFRSAYTMHLLPEDYRFIYCDFEFIDSHVPPTLFRAEVVKSAEGLFNKLLHLYRTNPMRNYAECMSVLYSIYASISHASEHISHRKNTNDAATHAKQRIEESFGDPNLSISALASEAGISEVYLRRLFRERYGVCPVKYLSSVRLKKAKELMEYPFFTLEECATKSGFSSVQYFGRVFKKEFGTPPGEYRRNGRIK